MRSALVTRLPFVWRAPALLLLSWRRWRPVLGGTALSTLGVGAVGPGRAELVMAVLLYAPPIAALVVLGGVFAHWRRPSVWTTIAQRRAAGTGDGWRLLLLAVLLYLGVLLPIAGTALATLAAAHGGPERALDRAALFAVVWSGISFLTVATVAVGVRRGVAGITIGWMMVPAILAVLGPALDLAKAVTESLAYLAPPFHAATRLHEVLSGERVDLTRRVVTHLATFPLLCAGLLAMGLQRLLRAPAAVDP
ncbi:MAG: hypothetical protein ACO327_07040 [Gemmatimonadaceae bacterium]|jgi:hypothetical protein